MALLLTKLKICCIMVANINWNLNLFENCLKNKSVYAGLQQGVCEWRENVI